MVRTMVPRSALSRNLSLFVAFTLACGCADPVDSTKDGVVTIVDEQGVTVGHAVFSGSHAVAAMQSGRLAGYSEGELVEELKAPGDDKPFDCAAQRRAVGRFAGRNSALIACIGAMCEHTNCKLKKVCGGKSLFDHWMQVKYYCAASQARCGPTDITCRR